MGGVIQRQYRGFVVTEDKQQGYYNATEACRAGGRRWNDYWALDSTKSYLESLSATTGIPVIRLVIAKAGRPDLGGGTWVHKLVFFHLAQWISPDFAVQASIWLNDIATQGYAVADPAVKIGPIDENEDDDDDEGDERLDMLESMIKSMKDRRREARRQAAELARVDHRVANVEAMVDAVKERVDGGHGYYTVMAYGRLTRRKITLKRAQNIGKTAAGICRARGIEIGNQRDERFGRLNTYPEDVLAECFGDPLQPLLKLPAKSS